MSEILAQITGNVHEQLQVTECTGYRIGRADAEAYSGAYSQGTMQQAYFPTEWRQAYADEGMNPLP